MTNEEFLKLEYNSMVFSTTVSAIYIVKGSKLDDDGTIATNMQLIAGEGKEKITSLDNAETFEPMINATNEMSPREFAAHAGLVMQINSVSQAFNSLVQTLQRPQTPQVR